MKRLGVRGLTDEELIQAIEDELSYQATDPEVVIGQWRGRATRGGESVSLTGLVILRVRRDEIVHCHDFMDAVGIARALGRQPFESNKGSAV
jgi:ketosteroid isomerase-like protein